MKNIPPPAIVRQAEEADAAFINAEHEAGQAAIKKGLEHYRRGGERLLAVRKRLRHGQWLPWLKANVNCSQQTASNYMRLAKLPTVGSLGEAEA
jgi:hypothetical protein